MYKKIIDKLGNKNICILGFGKEGISTYKFIRRHLENKFITIIDQNDVSNLVDKDKNVKVIYGEHYLENLDNYDLIIKTPGISFKNIDITNFKDKITSQFQLLLEIFKENTIAITGTKGKSTTSTLIYKIIKDQGYDTYLLGNISKPIFDDVEKFNKDTYLVVEISALQLEFVNLSPHIGIVLNLLQDHLDHSGTIYHYHENKMNMFKYQDSNDYAIYSLNDINSVNWVNNNTYLSKKYKVTINNHDENNVIYLKNNNVVFNNKIIYTRNDKCNLLGEHNLSNIMFSLLVANILGLDINKAVNTIDTFIPLEHRMELVGTYNDITYYNDSIATIPMATINAVRALKNVDTLIFGGMDRGIDYSELIDFLIKCDINNLICMPATGYKIGEEIKKVCGNKNIYFIELLKDAVDKAKEVTQKGKICLMSPAASSYEYFKNFEEKGQKYKEYVKGN